MGALTRQAARPSMGLWGRRLTLPAPLVGDRGADAVPTIDAVSRLSLHHAVAAATDPAAVAKVAAALPGFFLDLVSAGIEAPAVSRTLTLLHDDITRRLLALAVEQCGPPPVDFAWLSLGSAARSELTLASDQDHGLAYAGVAEPAIDAYFARVAEIVTAGLAACGLKADSAGVTAADPRWRLPLETWMDRLARCFAVPNESHIMGASIAFDFRQIAGDLPTAEPYARIVSEAPRHPAFLAGMGATVRETQSPLRLGHRLTGRVDLKRSGSLVIANLARYLALSHGLSATSTLDRLTALEKLGLCDEETMQSLQSSFVLMADLRMRRHADLLRAGRPPDNEVDTDGLPRIVRAGLKEALRIVDESQRLLPPILHGWT